MIGTCKNCGNAYETTEEDADIPFLLCRPPGSHLPDMLRFYYKNRSEARKA